MKKPPARFPSEAARDLVGIVRAFYASARESGAPPHQLEKIARVGAELAQALKEAEALDPKTEAYAAAWRRAELATARVTELVDLFTPAKPLFEAARQRVSGDRITLRKKRPER